MAKIKILFTIPNFDTAGSGKAMLNIIKRLDPDLFSPEICCFHSKGSFFKTIQDSGFPIHIFQYTTPMKPRIKGILNVLRIARFFRSIRPHIIHSFHYSSDYSEPLAARLIGIKWVYTKKNMSWGGASKNSWRLRSALANSIMVQNTDMLQNFFPGVRKVMMVPRGVELEAFKFSKMKTNIIQQFGIPEDSKIIIAVANLVPVKGIEILIHAFSRLDLSQRPFLLIVGDDQNSYGAEIKQLVNHLGIQGRTVFTGKQADVVSFLNQAYLFVLPTLDQGRREGSPVSMLEAMANGRAVLGSRVPGIKDQLKEFPELLFEPGNIDELTNKLNWILSFSVAEYEHITEQTTVYVSKHYSIELEVGRHQEGYLRCIK